MTQYPNPHSRHRHIFVVIRLHKSDLESGAALLGEEDVTLTKAFLKESAARAEVERLNELNGDYWSYFFTVARLVEEPDD